MNELDSEDVFLWPDGTYCHRYEYCDMSHMSDDFEIIIYDSPRWREFIDDKRRDDKY